MWRELTEQDLRDALSDREVESYTRAAAGPETVGWWLYYLQDEAHA